MANKNNDYAEFLKSQLRKDAEFLGLLKEIEKSLLESIVSDLKNL